MTFFLDSGELQNDMHRLSQFDYPLLYVFLGVL